MDIFGELDSDIEGNLLIINISTDINNFSEDLNVYKCVSPSLLVTTAPSDWDELTLYWKPWNCIIEDYGYLYKDKFYSEDSDEIPDNIELQVKLDTYNNGKLVNTIYCLESEYGNIC